MWNQKETNRSTLNRPKLHRWVPFLAMAAVCTAFFYLGDTLISAKTDGWSSHRSSRAGLADNYIHAIEFDQQGTAWIGTGNGVNAYDGLEWQTYRLMRSQFGFTGVDANSIAVEESGQIWVATSHRGIKVFNGSYWREYSERNSDLPVDTIATLASDSLGRLWIGTSPTPAGSRGAGVLVFDGETLHTFDMDNSPLTTNNISAVAVDSSDSIWIGTWRRHQETQNGLIVLHADGTWSVLGTSNSGPLSDSVLAIEFDAGGRAWVGTQGGGLAILELDETGELAVMQVELDGESVADIAFDHLDRAWVGTSSGLYVLDGKRWRRLVPMNSGLSNRRVSAVSFDGDHSMWIGTRGDGLHIVDLEQLQIVNVPQVSQWVIILFVSTVQLALLYGWSQRSGASTGARDVRGADLTIARTQWILASAIGLGVGFSLTFVAAHATRGPALAVYLPGLTLLIPQWIVLRSRTSWPRGWMVGSLAGILVGLVPGLAAWQIIVSIIKNCTHGFLFTIPSCATDTDLWVNALAAAAYGGLVGLVQALFMKNEVDRPKRLAVVIVITWALIGPVWGGLGGTYPGVFGAVLGGAYGLVTSRILERTGPRVA